MQSKVLHHLAETKMIVVSDVAYFSLFQMGCVPYSQAAARVDTFAEVLAELQKKKARAQPFLHLLVSGLCHNPKTSANSKLLIQLIQKTQLGSVQRSDSSLWLDFYLDAIFRFGTDQNILKTQGHKLHALVRPAIPSIYMQVSLQIISLRQYLPKQTQRRLVKSPQPTSSMFSGWLLAYYSAESLKHHVGPYKKLPSSSSSVESVPVESAPCSCLLTATYSLLLCFI